jgi:hypothetical protein
VPGNALPQTDKDEYTSEIKQENHADEYHSFFQNLSAVLGNDNGMKKKLSPAKKCFP